MAPGPRERFLDEHDDEISEFADKFATYVTGIDKVSVRRWLAQFNVEHLGIALKLLRNVDFYSQSQVVKEQKELHKQLGAMAGDREILFASFGSAGESGDEFIHKYRLANRLTGKQWNEKFIHLSELTDYFDKVTVCFAFIDDFVGTGDQAIETWNGVSPVINEANDVYLLVLCAMTDGLSRIQESTRMRVITNRTLSSQDKIFSDDNHTFTLSEKRILKEYCAKAGSEPEGYGQSQSTVVFYCRAPDNTISILRSNNKKWKGLFIRNP